MLNVLITIKIAGAKAQSLKSHSNFNKNGPARPLTGTNKRGLLPPFFEPVPSSIPCTESVTLGPRSQMGGILQRYWLGANFQSLLATLPM